MADFFSLKAVPTTTRQELAARGSRTWNPALGQERTWIHVMSMAEGANLTLSRYTTFGEAYNLEFNRPRLVISSFKISAKGEFGTTRQGTLQMTVFDDNTMNELAEDYFIPDMSVRVQFGWSVSAVGGGGEQPALYTDTSYDSVAQRAMQKIASRYPGYEGYQGRVVNWEIKLIPDINAWDVTLTLVGAADAVAETSVSHVSDQCNCNKEVTGQTAEGNNETTEVVEKVSNIEGALLELYENPDRINSIKADLKGNHFYFAETIAYPGFSRDETGAEDSSGFMWIKADLDAEETFISWGTVEALLSRTSGQTWDDNGPTAFILDSTGTKLTVPKQEKGRWFSADPRVCILPGGGVTFEEPTTWTDYVGGEALDFAVRAISYIATGGGTTGRQDYAQPSGNCFDDDFTVDLTKIMVSTIHLLKRMKEFQQSNTPFMQALMTILNDINGACGNVWELDVIDISTAEGVTPPPNGAALLAIVDLNQQQKNPDFTFQFIANPGKGGFCRDIQLDLKPTDAMKTQALYGGQQAEKTPLSGNPCGSKFITYTRDKKANLGKAQNANKTPPANYCNDGEKCNKENEKEHPIDKLQKEAVGINIDGAKAYLREQKSYADTDVFKKDGGSPYCTSTILPMNFSVSVSGIGGFKWGQSVSCDRIPPDMTKACNWQVTTVEHEVTTDDWVTKINTVARLKTFSERPAPGQ